uniref:Peptidase A1 domain-containing protein n=1 Tax=Ananas comosus var. bracteatus TaxID=296719 RepID=A0A6V7P7L1_ANACO|nr:unnamed protein product [Ananas comosus var. bracteatus]
MAQLWHATLLLLFLSLTVVHSLHFNLIHKYSVHSPLFPGNLTEVNKVQRLYEGDMARARFLRPSLFGLNYSVELLRPNLKAERYNYLIEVFIGTPARRKYYLVFDTASAVVWLQCKPCIHCWKQDTQIFHPAKESSSFEPIPCNHTLCDLTEPGWKCVKGKCHYTLEYGEGSSSRGILASETLGFASEGPGKESVRNFVFGCANDNRGFQAHEEFSGIFGLNTDRWSPANQLTDLIGGRFSYCFSPIVSHNQPPSRLKFGNEAVLRGPRVKTINIVRLPAEEIYQYPLPLSDVSVAGRRLGFKRGDFAIRKRADGHMVGGFIIDSGSTHTAFSTGGPYERITAAFRAYFRPFKLQPSKHRLFDVCYRLPREGFKGQLPSMTLHFGDHADYIVQPKYTMVEVARNTLCVAITSYPGFSLLGLYHQYDYHFSFNVKEMFLSFVPADCSKVV